MRTTTRLVVIALLVVACGTTTPSIPVVASPIDSAGHSVPPSRLQGPKPTEPIAVAVTPAPAATPPVESIALEVSQDPAFDGDRLTFTATSSPTGGPSNLLISSATFDFGDGSSATAAGSCAAGLGVAHAYRNAGDFRSKVIKVVACNPGQTADLSYADVRIHVFPAAPAQTASWPLCSTFQLQLAGPWTGAGLGNVATLITLRNVGTRGCRLEGYPQLNLVATDGRLLPTHDSRALTGDYMFPAVVPHRVALGPGQLASFMIGYGDNPFGAATNEPQDIACPEAIGVRVTLPGTAQFGTAHAAIGACGGVVRVSAVVPGANGLRFP